MAKKKLESSSLQGKIIGRLREQELLRDLIESKKSEFIAIYGRRRVGKTYLIKNLMDSFPCVFFHVTGLQKGSSKRAIRRICKANRDNLLPKPINYSSEQRWRDAFEDLTQAINKIPKEKTVVLFFDEFPWMATPRSKLTYSIGIILESLLGF